jgi:glycosyltransferase involved in cell wall biosynthesis
VRVHRCNLAPRKKGRLSIAKNYLSFWCTSKRYLKHLKEEFDVVYSMSLSPLISIVGGTIYARRHHVRHVLHCLDLWPESPVATKAIRRGSLPYKVLHHWSKKIYSGLDKILVSSPSFEKYFRDELQVHNVPIDYVPQPPMLGHSEEAISYSHKVQIVYAGNIGTLQLVEEFVKAVAIAKKEIDVGMTIIGMGAREGETKELIASLGLEENVEFLGIKSRDAAAAYYKNATGIIVSLADEGWVGKTIPGKLNGALSYRRPIIAV